MCAYRIQGFLHLTTLGKIMGKFREKSLYFSKKFSNCVKIRILRKFGGKYKKIHKKSHDFPQCFDQRPSPHTGYTLQKLFVFSSTSLP